MFIYHITSAREWSAAQAAGVYTPANFNTDGFIHCSFKDQVTIVANKYYKDANDLVLLKIETDLVSANIVEENLEGGSEDFPHIYGKLPVKAVAASAPLPRNADGLHTFPPQLV
jgi:uncharacterized protein (DUF952 family)